MHKYHMTPLIKYCLQNIPNFKRSRFTDRHISLRKRADNGFIYFFKMVYDMIDKSIQVKPFRKRLPCEQVIPFTANENDNTTRNTSIYDFDDLWEYLEKDEYSIHKREYYEKYGYKLNNGIRLISAQIKLRYYTLEKRVAQSDYFGYDVNARDFPLFLELYIDVYLPYPYLGYIFSNKYGAFQFIPVGTNAYDLVLQKLSEHYAEFREKYNRQCQMTVDFLKDIMYDFKATNRRKSIANLYYCDSELIKALRKMSKTKMLIWRRSLLDDGRPYYIGVCNSASMERREIYIYPVEIRQEYYHTQTPYMYQIKSDKISRFFLPGTYLGRRLVHMLNLIDNGSLGETSTRHKLSRKLMRALQGIDNIRVRYVAMINFSESLLVENERVFLQTLQWKTKINAILWRSVNSEFTLDDGDTYEHDFWETNFTVGEKEFHIELRRIFIADVYDCARDPYFTEIIANDVSRIFDIASTPGRECFELYKTILEQRRTMNDRNENDEEWETEDEENEE